MKTIITDLGRQIPVDNIGTILCYGVNSGKSQICAIGEIIKLEKPKKEHVFSANAADLKAGINQIKDGESLCAYNGEVYITNDDLAWEICKAHQIIRLNRRNITVALLFLFALSICIAWQVSTWNWPEWGQALASIPILLVLVLGSLFALKWEDNQIKKWNKRIQNLELDPLDPSWTYSQDGSI